MEDGMKFGFLLECDHGFDDAVEQAVLAEKLGYDSVLIAEHHNYAGYVPHPLVALAALAMKTERVQLGTYVVILPFYNPVQVAEQAAMVDYISKGRLILGVGLGYVKEEFEMMGVPYEDRVGRMEEGIPIIRRVWTEDGVQYAGKHFRFAHAAVYPKPVQKPHPPIWVGAWVETAIRRAARLADAWAPGPTVELEKLHWCYDIYRDELKKQGKSLDIEYPAARELYCGRTNAEARERGGEHVYQFYKDTYLKWPHPHLKEKGITYENIVPDRFIIGDPAHCIQAIEKFRRELGINHLMFRMQAPGITRAATLDSMRRFASEVMPHFRKA
jgi:probable F420-dependent oxidoreductase